MKVSTLSEVKRMDGGLPVPCVRGILKTLFKPKRGEGQYGPWCLQNGELTDGKTTVKVLFANRDEEVPQNWRGKQVVITSYRGDKGWEGVIADDNEYKGTTTRQIKVTKTAEVALDDGAEPSDNDGGEAPAPRRNTTTAAPTNKPGLTTPPAVPGGVFGGTVGMCIKEACTTVNALGTDPFSVEYYQQVKRIASSLIRVSLDLEKGKLSPAPWAAEAPKPAPKPEPEPEADEAEGDEIPM